METDDAELSQCLDILATEAGRVSELYKAQASGLRTIITKLQEQNNELGDRNATLLHQLETVQKDLSEQRSPDLQLDEDSALLQQLLNAQSQIIHAKDDRRESESRSSLLEKEVLELKASLDIIRVECSDANDRAAEASKYSDELKEEKSRLTAQVQQLEIRLENERKTYERTLKGKELIISELEETSRDRKPTSPSVPPKTDKENLNPSSTNPFSVKSPLQDRGTGNKPQRPTYEARYRTLQKHLTVLQSKYDLLQNTYLKDSVAHQDREAHWKRIKKKWLRLEEALKARSATLSATKSAQRLQLGEIKDVIHLEADEEDFLVDLLQDMNGLERTSRSSEPATTPIALKKQKDPSTPADRTSTPTSRPGPSRLSQLSGQVPAVGPSPTESEDPLSQSAANRLKEIAEQAAGPPIAVKQPRIFEPDVWKFRPRDEAPKAEIRVPHDSIKVKDEADAILVGTRPATEVKRRLQQDAEGDRTTRKSMSRSVGKPLFLPPTHPASDLDSPSVTALGKRKMVTREIEDHAKLVPQNENVQVSTSKAKNFPHSAQYNQYKGRGRYAQAATDKPPAINAEFEIDKSKNDGLDFQYNAVVRNHEHRKKMDATDCECCKDYYDAVGPLPPVSRVPQWRSPSPGPSLRQKYDGTKRGTARPSDARDDLRFEDGVTEHRKEISRHRHDWLPGEDPHLYWDIGFPTTQDIQAINERGEAYNQAKRSRIEREVEKKDGRYRRRG